MSRTALAPWLALAGAGAAWWAVSAWHPADNGPVLCPFRWLTGWDCPFCGATRAAAALGHGQLGPALDHNAFFVLVILPVAAVLWVLWLRRSRVGAPTPVVPTRALNLAVAVIGVWWLLRLVVPWLGSGLTV